MRKTKQEIKGDIQLIQEGLESSTNLKSLGHLIKPTYNGLINGTLVNDRMLIIEMQQAGIKLSKTFHYSNSKTKKDICNQFVFNCNKQIKEFLEKNYIEKANCSLTLEEVYDEDYCVLPLSEATADLSQNEFQEVIKEMSNYAPTISPKRQKRNVLFD